MYQIPSNIDNFSYKNIQDIQNKRVLLRSCLNVAVDNEGKVTDDTRLKESMPLIKELASSAKALIITAHLGRPTEREKKSSFWHVAELIKSEVPNLNFVENLDEVGAEGIYLLDNIRFFSGEESKDLTIRMNFAKELANIADVFVNDAFADYRESASTYDVATLLPSYIGSAFLKEVDALGKFNNPNRPFVAILGGAKLSEKLDVLNSLGNIADKIIIGGAMAYTLMKAKGISIGKSLVEEDKIEVAKEIINKFGYKLMLPVDHLVSPEFNIEAKSEHVNSQEIPQDKIAIDIGQNTIESYVNEISNAQTILWNGPMGVFEWAQSEKGTKEIGKAIENNSSAYRLAGGGDSIAAINKFNLKGFNHISTGGGAMLAFLGYDKFPTLDIIIK